MNKKSILLILTLGVFGIINTEMGVVGILPMLADHFNVSITKAGLFVSLFALVVAFSGPIMPLVFSKVNRKKIMITILTVFLVSNVIQAFTTSFYVALIARIIPAFFHPVYVSLAFSVAASTISEKEAPKAVAKVMLGVSAGMVLGVPVVSFLSSAISLRIGMLSFAVVNGLVLCATFIFVPSLPVEKRLTYGEQVLVLKYPIVWLSIIAVILLNSSIFGVYSYFAEYMMAVAGFSEKIVSLLLLIYGLMNMVGNMIAGKELSKKPNRLVLFYPMLLLGVYILLFFTGQLTIITAVVTVIWGILAGIGANINQYWITSVVLDAPDFGNGLFLAATNLGTTIGTLLCGFLIAQMGTAHIMLGGIGLIILCSVFLVIRLRNDRTE